MGITPGAAGASFDVLLAFSLDKEANDRVQKGVSTMEAELKRLQEEAAAVGTSYKKGGEEVKKTNEQLKKEAAELAKQMSQQGKVMKAEAAVIVSSLQSAQIGALKQVSSFIGGISQSAALAGAAITGGIFAEVQNYVNNAKRATVVTDEWKASTDSLARSRTRIDEVLAREALPLLQQAAKVANQAASFVEKHPEIVAAALKTGVVLAGIGAVGTLVSKGIKLVADVSSLGLIAEQLTAAKLQDSAADKQLAAAELRAGQKADIPGPVAKGGSLLGGIPLLSILGGAAAYTAIGRKAANFGAGLVGTTPEKFWQDLIGKVGESIPFVKKFGDAIFGTGEAAKKGADDLSVAKGQLAGSSNEAAIVDAFQTWKEDDARLVKEAADNRAKIIEEGEKKIADITKQYTDQRVSINAQYNNRAADITRQFNEENQKALDQYNKARADAIKNESDQLARIAQDRQDRLAQIEKDGADRLGELAATRDALGFSKEQERIGEEKKAANEDAKKAADRVRQETAAKLVELANQYAQEQAQRQQKFAQDLADNEAQRQAELQQAAQKYQEELIQQKAAQAAKLKDLQDGLNAERLRRREAFIAQVNDLDAYILGDLNIRKKGYAQALIDAQNFFNSLHATFSGGSTTTAGVTGAFAGVTPGHDYTGYAYSGLYRMAQDGMREFVLGGQATKAAERAIGSTLTEDNLLRALTTGSNRSVQYNDYRRMDGPTSKDDRALLQRAAEAALMQAIGV